MERFGLSTALCSARVAAATFSATSTPRPAPRTPPQSSCFTAVAGAWANAVACATTAWPSPVGASDYRLTPESPWPAQVHDVKAAIRWMRASALRLGIDPSRIAIEGHSAGAHLALLAAGTPGLPAFEGDGGNPGVATDIAAVVAVYPPVRFHLGNDRASGSTPATALMGEAATMEDARAAGPIEYAAANFPPTLLLHGSADKVVPPTASLRMYEALSQAGAPVEIHMYANLPHGFARLPSMLGLVQDEIANFLDRHIVDPGRVKREVDQLLEEMAATRTAAAR